MMLFDLLILATSLGLTDGSALDLAVDVRHVAMTEAPLFATDDGREATARLLLVWTIRESAGRSVMGDHGAACGAMQLHEVARQGVACADMLADRRVALRAGLAWMRAMRDQCGSVVGGLRAFASGSCVGTPRARDLVRVRCALAGGC